ncbi:hypothetical protein [Anabaena azotica]|nr:hypothetical protein [Anabaena azotica]
MSYRFKAFPHLTHPTPNQVTKLVKHILVGVAIASTALLHYQQ